MPAETPLPSGCVQSTFKVALEKGLLSRINRGERNEMIVMVPSK